MDVAQSASFITSMTYEAALLEYEDFPKSEEPVWLMGQHYSALYDLEEIKHDVLSRIWCTYRRGYAPIGGTGPTYDQGWGCMLRCGQMMVAQALINRHLGRDWRWDDQKYNPKYEEVLQMFLDKKSSCYSIHQIARMGASEGKAVGEWFGPNTVAQVFKKLAVYDEWSNMAVHVALDNTVIINDVKTLCRCKCDKKKCKLSGVSHPRSGDNKHCDEPSTSEGDNSPTLLNGLDCDVRNKTKKCNPKKSNCSWKPLLLIIPLRLGLSEMNPVYINPLKTCLTFKHSVGIIGGKPNHAYWFIGYVDDELIYLDPHTPQSAVDVSEESDESYHCPYVSRMKISQLDPSIAIGFFCATEADFDDLALSIEKFIIHGQKTPMFELHEKRPPHWPPFEPYSPKASISADFTLLEERQYDTDEEFELL